MIEGMGENLISITEAMKIMGLSRAQIVKLCTKGRLEAQKIGNTWIVSRLSAENYKPAPRGFSVVWEKRRAKEAELNKEIETALAEAKNREVKE